MPFAWNVRLAQNILNAFEECWSIAYTGWHIHVRENMAENATCELIREVAERIETEILPSKLTGHWKILSLRTISPVP